MAHNAILINLFCSSDALPIIHMDDEVQSIILECKICDVTNTSLLERVGSGWSVAHFYVSLWWDRVHHRKILQRNNSWTPLADAVLCMELREDYDKVSCWKLLLIKVIRLNTCWMPRIYSICQGCRVLWKCCLGGDLTIKRCKKSENYIMTFFAPLLVWSLMYKLNRFCSSFF